MATNNSFSYKGSLNMNILDTLGLVTSSFGAWEGIDGSDSAEIYNPDNYQYINLQFKDDVLVGANTVGYHQHLGVLRGLIEGRVPLGVWKERLKDNPVGLMDAYIGVTQEATGSA